MQLHLVTKEIWNVAMALYAYLPVWVIDKLVLLMCAVVFGDTSRHGLRRPAVGPFTMKLTTPAYPVVDVGTYAKIRTGEIRVLPAAVKSVRGNVVEFGDGKRHPFDAIVFATGYRSTVTHWLKVSFALLSSVRHIYIHGNCVRCTALHHDDLSIYISALPKASICVAHLRRPMMSAVCSGRECMNMCPGA
jgi:hypothetical protein